MRLNKLTFFLGLTLTLGVLFSCKTQKETVLSFNDLDGSWSVIEIKGKTMNPETSNQLIVLDIPRQTISGNAGCNRMMGKIEYNNDRKSIIKFMNLSTTRMACPDLENEQALLDALGNSVRFVPELNDGNSKRIAFYGIDNTKLIVIQKQ